MMSSAPWVPPAVHFSSFRMRKGVSAFHPHHEEEQCEEEEEDDRPPHDVQARPDRLQVRRGADLQEVRSNKDVRPKDFLEKAEGVRKKSGDEVGLERATRAKGLARRPRSLLLPDLQSATTYRRDHPSGQVGEDRETGTDRRNALGRGIQLRARRDTGPHCQSAGLPFLVRASGRQTGVPTERNPPFFFPLSPARCRSRRSAATR